MSTTENPLLVSTIFKNAGYNLLIEATGDFNIPVSLQYCNNPDGSIRWVWPAGSKKAQFLRFYNISSRRAKVFAALFKTAFLLRLSKAVSKGTVTLYTNDVTLAAMQDNWGGEFAIFTGTVGPNRKALIWYYKEERGYFIKVALSAISKDIIEQEKKVLTTVSALPFCYLKTPVVTAASPYSITVSDVYTSSCLRSNILTGAHEKALAEVHALTSEVICIKEVTAWRQTEENLAALSASPDKRIPKGLVRKLQHLSDSIDVNSPIISTAAHGDFTPWNMFVADNGLHVYDWELAVEKAPALWDAFHFIIQSSVLISWHSATRIAETITGLQQQSWVQNIISSKEEFNLHFQLYLLCNATYYLQVYTKQDAWHIQVNWLLKVWNELLSITLNDKQVLTQRQLLSMDIFDFLLSKPYASLKWIIEKPEDLPLSSDIDIYLNKNQLPSLQKYIQKHPFTGYIKQQPKSFMCNYTIVTKEGSLLSLDAIWQFKRKELQLLNADDVEKNTQLTNTGIKVPVAEIDFIYAWLFYTLNNASLPQKYQDYYLDKKNAAKKIETYLHYKWPFTKAPGFNLNNTGNNKEQLMQELKSAAMNKGWNGIKNKLFYYTDTMKSSFAINGMIITFSGVDGAGKSTVIENIREQIEKGLRKRVVVLRHRPSVLPIISAWKYGKETAETKAATTLPRQGNNKSSLSSLFRFAYYYTDYFFGQFYILFRYVLRGYVVLYDRYYFDFINDSKRSNIQLSSGFTSVFYRFLIKPDLNFFLYAQPEEILKRKQELDATTIKELTGKYLQLFSNLSKRYGQYKYIPVHNQQLDVTVGTIINHVKNCT